MKNPFSKETQFELFPETAVSETRKQQSYDIFNRTFYVSLENLAVAGIIMAVIIVIVFAFGIERGRRMKSAEVAGAVAAPAAQIQPPAGGEARVQRGITSREAQLVPAPVVSSVAPEPVPALDSKPSAAAPEKSVDKTASLETIHTVQVASFRQAATAQKEADDLKKGGYDAFTVQKGSHYIVCVGRFTDSQQANEMMRLLRRRYSDCYVRRL